MLPIFLENFTFPGARNLADLIFVLTFLTLMLFRQSLYIKRRDVLLFLSIVFVFSMNAYYGFQNVSLNINLDMYNEIKWLIIDRGIKDFVPFNDYYRNSLIYLRYLLIPLYFSCGYYLSHKYGRDKILFSIYNITIVALFANVIIGIMHGDERVAGLFDNTATLSSLALLNLFLSFFSKCTMRIVASVIICSITMILSQTVSAYLAVFCTLGLLQFKFRYPHKVTVYITVIMSIIASAVGLFPSFIELISNYVYTGSLMNRLSTWSVLISYINTPESIIFGLGSFPLFSDNIFVWLVSGFGVFAVIIYYYVYSIGKSNKETSILITVILWQGMLFPGFIMPYMLITTFSVLGILSYSDNK